MKDYKEIRETSHQKEVNKLKKQGWELINYHTVFYGDGSNRSHTVYVLAYPYEHLTKQLKQLLKEVEGLVNTDGPMEHYFKEDYTDWKKRYDKYVLEKSDNPYAGLF